MTIPEDDLELFRDCEALLAAKETLAGTGTLDWSADQAISSWEGVTTGGAPSRVTKVVLPGEGLSGSIPPELENLFELRTLDLSKNSLAGEIPAKLGRPYNLQELRLGDASVALSWDAVANASTCRVEYRRFGDWTVDDETITGTAQRWTGFRAGAYTGSR